MSIMPKWLWNLHHPMSGLTGRPDDHTWHPDGELLVRIDDHWLFAKDCEPA